MPIFLAQFFFLRTSLVQWKCWHHRLNVETLWGPEFDPTQCQNRTNVVQCCVKFFSHCLNDCEVVRWADHSEHQISNPFETRGSFFEKVISPWRILVPLHFFVSSVVYLLYLFYSLHGFIFRKIRISLKHILYSPFCVQAKIIKLVGLKNGGR